MNITKTKYNPKEDTFIGGYFLDRDTEGNYLDVDSHLYYSKINGYYLMRTIIQVFKGTWETATDGEAESVTKRSHRRSIRLFRPMTANQVIRMIVSHSIPENENALEKTLQALDVAGIH